MILSELYINSIYIINCFDCSGILLRNPYFHFVINCLPVP